MKKKTIEHVAQAFLETKQKRADLAEQEAQLQTRLLEQEAATEAAARRVHEDRVRDLSLSARTRYADLLERLGR